MPCIQEGPISSQAPCGTSARPYTALSCPSSTAFILPALLALLHSFRTQIPSSMKIATIRLECAAGLNKGLLKAF